MRRHGGILDEWEPRSSRRRRTRFAVFLALIALACGFVFGHWTADRLAVQAAKEAGNRARQQLAAAVCADAYMKQPDAQARLDELIRLDLGKRAALLARDGWATMPDRSAPDPSAAARCAMQLGDAYTSLQKARPISAR